MGLDVVMAALGELVLERLSDGRFVRIGSLPSWSRSLHLGELEGPAPFHLEEVFPFLSVFLPEAEELWRRRGRQQLRSGFWTERRDGEEMHLEAAATHVAAQQILVITRNERLFSGQQEVLQRARELRLAHHALQRETEEKEVLVHAIVHDLAAPLHGILGALSLLSEQESEPQRARLTALALQAAIRQRQLIADILDVFSAEHGALAGTPFGAVDLAAAIDEVVAQAVPAAQAKGAAIEARVGASSLPVAADSSRLVRVLANLVDNAIRHAPAGTRVTVSARRDAADMVQVDVEDDGPGVSREVIPYLFALFSGGRGRAAGTGLGLYFCRITVERWGGGIGYERREGGGARFWLRLVAVERMVRDGQAAARR